LNSFEDTALRLVSITYHSLLKNYFSFKLTDILNDDCSDLMLRVSIVGLGILVIRIRRHILGSVFILRLQTFFHIYTLKCRPITCALTYQWFLLYGTRRFLK